MRWDWPPLDSALLDSKLMHSFVFLALTCIAYTINTGPPACKGWLHPWLQLHYYSGCISIWVDTKIGIDWLAKVKALFESTFWRREKKFFLVICSAWNCRPERLDLRDLWPFFGLEKSWRSDCPAIPTWFRRRSSVKRECPPLRPHQSLQNQPKEKRCFFNVPRDFLPFQIMLSYPGKWISLFGGHSSPRGPCQLQLQDRLVSWDAS